MNEDEKRKYDALQLLNDQNWAEFQEKTRLEWRLSFGLWTSMVAVIGSILAGKVADVDIAGAGWPAAAGAGVCVILIGLHIWFLLWIQQRLQGFRDNLRRVRNEMWQLLRLNPPQFAPRNILKQPPLYVQLGITCLLAVVLVYCVKLTRPKNAEMLNGTKDVPAIRLSGSRDVRGDSSRR